MKENEEEDFSTEVHKFLERLREGKVIIKNKEKLYYIINELKKTEKQKKRFLLYYGLMPNNNQQLTFSEIAKIDNCSVSAVRYSVMAIRNKIAIAKGNQKSQLSEIIKESEGKNV